MPDLSPAKLQLVKTIPKGRGWLYEPKLDGYRGIVGWLPGNRAVVVSRNNKDLGRWFPELIRLAESLPVGTAIDGEIVSPVDEGVSFAALQRRLMLPLSERAREAAERPVAFVAFDLLLDQSEDIRRLGLTGRRKRLDGTIHKVQHPVMQLVSQTPDANEAALWLGDSVMAGVEGVVAKRDEPYPKANVRRWQKVRRLSTMDVLVEGFAGDASAPRLVVGIQQQDGVRTLGMTQPLNTQDASRLRVLVPLAVRAERPVWSRFDSNRQEDWYRIPAGLVAEVAYSNLDVDSFRHAVRFVRWRDI